MEWVRRWNQHYERIPEDLRFGVVVAALLLVGMVNMVLTIQAGFPFALLLFIAILFVVGVRLAYVMETPPEARRDSVGTETGKLDIGWLHKVNGWYDRLPEDQQFWVLPVVLIAAGFVNMLLTIAHLFPFGLLFLFVLFALVAIRFPYSRGWVRDPPTVTHDAVVAPVPVAQPAPALSTTPASEPIPMRAMTHPPEPPMVE